MGLNSKIEWTHHTFNAWIGCTKVSPACDHCYAETQNKHRAWVDGWGKDAPRKITSDSYWREPLKWNRQAEQRERVFCGSLCDVMEDRPDLVEPRQRLYMLIESTPNLDWLLLTKRPQNFRRFLPQSWLDKPRHNVWGMTTVEANAYRWRIDALAETPFVVRGLSCEPLLDDLKISQQLATGLIHWVIAGGESGGGARPMRTKWARSLRDQCVTNGVAFHFKQWGEYDDGLVRVGKKSSGRELDGRTWDELPVIAEGKK